MGFDTYGMDEPTREQGDTSEMNHPVVYNDVFKKKHQNQGDRNVFSGITLCSDG